MIQEVYFFYPSPPTEMEFLVEMTWYSRHDILINLKRELFFIVLNPCGMKSEREEQKI